MNFHEVRFPANLSFGSTGGPERRTEIVTLANGYEERNTPWAQSRRRYDAGLGLRSLDDVAAMIAFFEARRGQLYGFRWKDWADFKSCKPSARIAEDDQLIGIGDGVARRFFLSKTYDPDGSAFRRPIRKLVSGSLRLAVAGDARVETVDFTINPDLGEVEFMEPPDIGVRITAGFEFDVPVRFDTDRIAVSVASFQAGEVPSVPVVEVRL